MCYTSVITPWYYFFQRFIHFWSPFILCWPQQIPLKKHGIAPKSGENNGNSHNSQGFFIFTFVRYQESRWPFRTEWTTTHKPYYESIQSKLYDDKTKQVRKTWRVTHVSLIMEEVLLVKVLNLWNKSHFYHLGRGGGRKGHSILAVTINRVSQFSLVPTLNSVSDDWSYLHSLWKPGDHTPPPHPQDLPTPPTPLPKRKMVTFSLLLLSVFQRI